ncbi:MAG: trehalose-phosphatase, partial [Acidimicrobiales bacterium]
MTRSSLDEVTDLLAKSPLRTAILTDFDGTLSPIIAVPESAEPLLGAVEALHRLAARYGFVGVVSGRPAAFLVERFR